MQQSIGMLQWRVVHETYMAHDGKEATMSETVEAGFEHDYDVIYTEHSDFRICTRGGQAHYVALSHRLR